MNVTWSILEYFVPAVESLQNFWFLIIKNCYLNLCFQKKKKKKKSSKIPKYQEQANMHGPIVTWP